MSTGKPQQAAGQTDSSSDDLIAELARLMASDAKSEKAAPPPAAEPARPQATSPAPAVPNNEVRVPGTFRIPGMSEPPLDLAAPEAAATQSSAPSVPPMRPSDAPPATDAWQAQPAPQRVEPEMDDRPRVASPMPAFAHLATPSPAASKPILSPRVNIAVDPDKKGPGGAPVIEPFKFDFGVVGAAPAAAEPKVESPAAPVAAARPFRIPGDEMPASRPQMPSPALDDAGSEDRQDEPGPQPQANSADDGDDDPIAHLIAAELKSGAAPAEDTPPEAGFVLRPAAAVSRPVTTPVAPRPQPAPSAAPQAGPTSNPIASTFQPSRLQTAEPKPQPAPPRDSFAAGPAFGLGNRPTPQVDDHGVGTDPIDEIEDLIGEAVRVELSAPPRQAGSLSAAIPAAAPVTKPLSPVAQQAPVVPPLNSGFAPRRASIKPTDEEVHAAAEEAILAAAAATGAEVGRLRNVERDRSEKVQAEKRSTAPRKTMNMKPLVGLAVAGTLLLAAGFGLYWVLGMGHSDADAPVLAADTTPVKEAAPAVTTDSDAPRSVVMDEIAGVASDEGEQLVSRDQSTEEAVTAPNATDTEAGLANRKVRTVTVRPDGTIVTSDDAVAGTTQLPVDRPNVPAMPAATLNGSDLLQGTPGTETATTDPIGAMVAASDPTAAVPSATDPAALPTSTAVVDPNLVAPVPAPRIVNREAAAARQTTPQPTNPVNAVVNNGGQTVDLLGNSQQQAAPSQTSGAVDAPAYVQLSSQRSEAEAQAAAQNIINRYGALFGGQQLEIRRVDLGAKGIYYRVRLPANSLQDASQLCNSVKANGGDCFAVNG